MDLYHKHIWVGQSNRIFHSAMRQVKEKTRGCTHQPRDLGTTGRRQWPAIDCTLPPPEHPGSCSHIGLVARQDNRIHIGLDLGEVATDESGLARERKRKADDTQGIRSRRDRGVRIMNLRFLSSTCVVYSYTDTFYETDMILSPSMLSRGIP